MVTTRDALPELSRTRRDSLQQTTCILVVDDDNDLSDVMRQFLEADGFTVLSSDGGSTALKIVAQYPGYIDLLLTDIHMPKMRGPELAKQARMVRPEMKVLFMSADASEAFASGELDSGALFLPKPFSWGILTEKVRGILRP